MKPFNYIASRLIGFVLILLIGSIIYQFTIYPSIKKSEGWLQHLAERQLEKNAEILYFSSSTNKAFGPNDTDQRSIVQIVQDSIQHKVVSIDTGAIHCGIFYEILQRIPQNQLPKKIIIDLNVRSFGNNWIHSGLENSLQRNLVYWNSYPGVINHLRASMKVYNYQSPAEHHRAIEYGEKFAELPFGNSHTTIKKWCDSVFKVSKTPEEGMTMIRHFGHFIDEKNSMLRNVDLIVEWGKKQHIPIVFIILPENVHRMEFLVGNDLRKLVEQNTDFLQKRYSTKNVHVINLVDDLDETVFFESFPTEHYTSVGRKHIAQKMIEVINSKK
jgi:hypothetical protein